MKHLVFVYGTLKSTSHNHRLLADAELIGPAVTVESYGMGGNDGSVPKVYANAPNKYRAPIVGELYRVDDEALAALDSLEGHPDWYKRERVQVGVLGDLKAYRNRLGMAQWCAWIYFMPVRDKRVVDFRRPRYVKGAAIHNWSPS